jgi:IS30 family transposase
MGNKLTYYDRQQIAFWHRIGYNAKRIAERIGKDRTVVWRELKRNRSPFFPYDADNAHYFSQRRAKRTNKPKLEKDIALRDYIVGCLRLGWSPEQISGRLKNHPPCKLKGRKISYEAIYQYIYDKEPWLYHKLRRAHPDRYRKFHRKKRPVSIPDRTPIALRDDAINSRQEIGHFESDSMIGKGHRHGLSVQFERAIQYVLIGRIENFTAEETKDAITMAIESLPDKFVKSITFDNGRENTQHIDIKNDYNIQTFFCDPYKAWQKGGVENVIGLIRQYLPKGTKLADITDIRVAQIQELLNSRPRKKLDYKTPDELLLEYKEKVKMLH